MAAGAKNADYSVDAIHVVKQKKISKVKFNLKSFSSRFSYFFVERKKENLSKI